MADLFRVSNKHGAGMGAPPHFDGDQPGMYYGYFENEHREQFVFRYDYEKQIGSLWLGDAGWEQSFAVVDGEDSMSRSA